MFRIAICDDEKIFAEELKGMISGYMTKKGLLYKIDIYSSGKELVALGFEVVQYTAVFLDINMEQIDGIRTAEKIREISKEVFLVFVTAYVDYSLEGYRFDVVRYLLKGTVSFRHSLAECMDAIIDKMNYSVSKMEFDFKEGKKEISLERLLYIESNLHKLVFHVMEDSPVVYTMNEILNTLEDRLAETGFVRIHQSYLVNMKHIRNIVRYKAVLTNGVELPIPKARYANVGKQFTAYRGEV